MCSLIEGGLQPTHHAQSIRKNHDYFIITNITKITWAVRRTTLVRQAYHLSHLRTLFLHNKSASQGIGAILTKNIRL